MSSVTLHPAMTAEDVHCFCVVHRCRVELQWVRGRPQIQVCELRRADPQDGLQMPVVFYQCSVCRWGGLEPAWVASEPQMPYLAGGELPRCPQCQAFSVVRVPCP